jgi:hypothetical protein
MAVDYQRITVVDSTVVYTCLLSMSYNRKVVVHLLQMVVHKVKVVVITWAMTIKK